MRRREFITLLGGTAAGWPLAARAQQSEPARRIGVLMGYPDTDAEGQAGVAAFQNGLQQLGWSSDKMRIDTCDDRHGNVTGKLILAAEIFDSDQNGTGIIGRQMQAHKWLGRSLTSGGQQRDYRVTRVT